MELLQLRLEERIHQSGALLDNASKDYTADKKATAEGSLAEAYVEVSVWPASAQENALDLEV
jgi:hypothetical protein